MILPNTSKISKPLAESDYLKRGLLYALTSFLALCSGFFLTTNLTIQNFFTIILIFLYSSFFFISYTICFPLSESGHEMGIKLKESLQRDAYVLSFIILVLCTIVFVQNGIQLWKIVLILLYGFIFFLYAIFLYSKYRFGNIAPVRHQIVWPTTLAIGLCLYYGINLENINQTWEPIIPIIFLLIFFLISETFFTTRKSFVYFSMGPLLIIALMPFLPKIGIDFIPAEITNSFYALLFCLITAAYLAVFESWRMTAHVSKFNDNYKLKSRSNLVNRYYIATLVALTISILGYPYIYIFNIYRTFFLIAFFFHAIFSFIFWFRLDPDDNSFLEKKWGRIKIIFGVVFLIILIVDSKINIPLPKHIHLSDLDSLKIIGLLITFSTYPLKKLWDSTIRYKKIHYNLTLYDFLFKLFTRKINIVRSLALFSLILCCLVLFIRSNNSENEYLQDKTFNAIIIYCIISVMSFFTELCHEFLRRTRRRVNLVTAFASTTRLLTSLLIGSIILLPAISNLSLFEHLLKISIVLVLTVMGGFTLNDYFDSVKDKINKVHRPIPRGILTKKATLHLSIFLLLVAILFLSFSTPSLTDIIFIAFVVIGITVYNLIIKYFAYLKSFFCAFLCCLPFFYIMKSYNFLSISYFLPLSIFFYISGRELLMDIHDVKGDQIDGIHTLPIILGKKFTQIVAFLFLFVGWLFFIPIAISSLSVISILLISLIFLIILLSFIGWDNYDSFKQRKLTLYLWLPLFLGLTVLVFRF